MCDTPSTQNLVGRGEVDAELESETSDECSTYGPVRRCVAVELPDDGRVREEEAVRVLVEFERAEDAVRAVKALHGRFFAKRRVTAALFDMDRYAQQRWV